MIEYRNDLHGLTSETLTGFFTGWPNHPSESALFSILSHSYRFVIAVDSNNGKVIGFTYAISDGILAAYIPLLEVLPSYQGRGIGKELVRRLMESLGELYMIDVVCDEEVTPFYKTLGFYRSAGMIKRNYEQQGGRL